MFMSAVEFLSDYSYRSVFLCKPMTPKAVLENETVGTKQMSYLFTCAVSHQMYILSLLSVHANE